MATFQSPVHVVFLLPKFIAPHKRHFSFVTCDLNFFFLISHSPFAETIFTRHFHSQTHKTSLMDLIFGFPSVQLPSLCSRCPICNGSKCISTATGNWKRFCLEKLPKQVPVNGSSMEQFGRQRTLANKTG